MAEGELINSREACEILGLSEQELQAMVARGDLRAFRSGGTMKFRREDVVSAKGEKGTEPTIIIPTQRKRGASGILAAVPAQPSAAPAPAAVPPPQDATGEIVFDDIELLPADDGMSTQQVTVQQTAVGSPVSAPTEKHPIAGRPPPPQDLPLDQGTVVEQGTGEVTVVDAGSADEQTATGPAAAVAPPRRRPSQRGAAPVPVAAPMPAPRVSQSRVASIQSRRVSAVYQAQSGSPVWTILLVVASAVMVYLGSLYALMLWKGFYDPVVKDRPIPGYLKGWYDDFKKQTPGLPED
jgi:excisionase family DNA binding protein